MVCSSLVEGYGNYAIRHRKAVAHGIPRRDHEPQLVADQRHGNGEHQAAKGNHDHDGKNGRALWAVADVPGDLPASPTTAQFRDTINQILPLLRAKAAE
jgi:hypothetical protein